MSISKLTEYEKNLLLRLSYLDLPKDFKIDPKNPPELKRIISQIEMTAGNDKNETVEEIKSYLGNPNNNLSSLKLTGYENNNPSLSNLFGLKSNSGFVGYAFEDNQGNGTAVFRGSEPIYRPDHFLSDWISNIEAAMGITINQHKEANAFYENYLADVQGERLLMGHSKGGNITQTVFVNHLDDNTKAYVVNGAPIYWWDLTDEQKKELMSNRHDFIVYENDVVSQLGFAPYVKKTVETIEPFSIKNPIYPHELTSAGFNEFGEFANWHGGGAYARYYANKEVSDLIYGTSQSGPALAYKTQYVVSNAIMSILVENVKGRIEDAKYIANQTGKLIGKIQQLSKDIESKVKSFLVGVAVKTAINVTKFIDSMNGNNFPIEPYIKVDIPRLFYYANRLRSVQRRIAQLNDMIDDLYWEAGVMGLDNVLAADIASSFDIRVPESINYLNRTAELLQQNERYLAGKAGSIRG
jgi:hypothetical protein